MDSLLEICSFIFAALAFMLLFVFTGTGYIHMLQLNSYRIERYTKWMITEKSRLFAYKALILLISLAFFALGKEGVCIAFGMLAPVITPFKKKAAKKPLVYTARVKRLITVYAVLGLAICILAYFVKGVFSGVKEFLKASFETVKESDLKNE